MRMQIFVAFYIMIALHMIRRLLRKVLAPQGGIICGWPSGIRRMVVELGDNTFLLVATLKQHVSLEQQSHFVIAIADSFGIEPYDVVTYTSAMWPCIDNGSNKIISLSKLQARCTPGSSISKTYRMALELTKKKENRGIRVA